jgi:hypothetical protein
VQGPPAAPPPGLVRPRSSESSSPTSAAAGAAACAPWGLATTPAGARSDEPLSGASPGGAGEGSGGSSQHPSFEAEAPPDAGGHEQYHLGADLGGGEGGGFGPAGGAGAAAGLLALLPPEAAAGLAGHVPLDALPRILEELAASGSLPGEQVGARVAVGEGQRGLLSRSLHGPSLASAA